MRLPGVKKVVIFDYTIRRRVKDAPRQLVQQVHVDQTPGAVEERVCRHLPVDEAEELLKGRYQIINAWRPIENPASDLPLAVIDWRTTDPADFKEVDLLYPKRDSSDAHDDDDRGKKGFQTPTPACLPMATRSKFYYAKDMAPEEVMLLKCFDSRGEGMSNGIPGLAVRTPHTAFEDPETPANAPGR